MVGDPQVVVQSPPKHACPPGQPWPHAPQLVLSVFPLTSQPSDALWSQSKYPALHDEMVQALAVHAAVALAREQAWPHAPQSAVVLARLVSQPLDAMPSQSPKPAEQVPTVHAEDTHPSAVVWVRAHTVPHALQLEGSLEVLAQYPEHVVSGDAQVVVHAPPEHTVPAAHVWPHAPQLALSDCKLASQPSAAEWLQSAKPVLQEAMPQAPAVQLEEALARAHARPQAPQSARVVLRLVSQPLPAMPSQSP